MSDLKSVRPHPGYTAVELRLECTFSMLPRSARNERGEGKSNKTKLLSPTHNNQAHPLALLVRRLRAKPPERHAAEKIRDVGDNVPPRWEGCCPQRPIIFLRDARTNNSPCFVGRKGENRFRFRCQFQRQSGRSLANPPERLRRRKIRDVRDNVPPRWEGCCPQRPIIFLGDARMNNSSSFVGREGENRFRFRPRFQFKSSRAVPHCP